MSEFLVLALAIGGAIFFAQKALAPVPVDLAARLEPLEDRPRPESSAIRLRKGKAGTLRALGAQFEPLIRGMGLADRLERLLGQAAMPWTPGEFAMATALAGVGGGLVGLALTWNPLLALVFLALGVALPLLQLAGAARRRVKALNEQLPEAILLLATALRSGNSFLQAMQILGRQLPEPLAGEIRATVQEINWGASFEDALRGLQDRVGTVEMEMVVMASLVQRQVGGNLSEILTNVHDMVRDRIRLRGDVQALTAQGRASAAILTVLPVGLGLVLSLLNPAYIRVLFIDPRGQAMLAAAVVMMATGSVAIRRIVNVRY